MGRDATHLQLAVRARLLALLVLAIPIVVLGDRVSLLALASPDPRLGRLDRR